MERTNDKIGQRGKRVVLEVRKSDDRRVPVVGRRLKPATESCKGCGYTIAKGAGYCGECLCEEDGI